MPTAENAPSGTCTHLKLLSHIPILSGCPTHELESIGGFSSVRNLDSQQVLFWQDEPCLAIYYVISGQIKLSRRSAQSEVVLDMVEEGQGFAECAVYAGNGYPYTAAATTDSELVAIQAYPFVRFTQSHPKLASRVLGHISRSLQDQLFDRESLILHNAEQRVARYLLSHCDDDKDAACVRCIPKRRSDLASLLAMTPETLCRILKRFEKAQWIAERNGSLIIEDSTGLRKIMQSAAG